MILPQRILSSLRKNSKLSVGSVAEPTQLDTPVKEYIEGMCGHEWLAHGVQDQAVIEQLFLTSSELRAHGLNIDYFPRNFVNARAGMAEYARSGNRRGSNENVGSGIPIRAPFEEQVSNWRAKFKPK